jgi:acetoacetyl-CoA synthetase
VSGRKTTEIPSDTAPAMLWRCPPELLAGSRLTAFERWLGREHGVTVAGYNDLWQWSVDNLETFWESVWRFFGVRASTPYTTVLEERRMPGARWFPGAELNFAEHCLRDRDGGATAIVHESELRPAGEWTWADLRTRAAAIAGGLRALGVGRGDRVAAYMPNIPEAVAAFLGVSSLGATWSSCSPDFGAPAVIDRFRQIEPRVLLAVDGYRYGGRDFDRTDTVDELRRALPSVEHTVLLSYLGTADDHAGSGTLRWADLERLGAGSELTFAQVPFDHPLWILYSSGTTGLPKPIVHGHGGVLLEQLKLHRLHHDLRDGDRFFWFSTTGWVMWNVVVSALLAPASVVLYDGNPAYPDHDRLWAMADRAGVTHFGASAAFLGSCERAGLDPVQSGRLARLRAIGSTGSPLAPETFRWVYDRFPSETWLLSISGGTDVAGAFVGGVLTMPVYEGEISARMLGVSVESWDPDGRALVGRTGELVVTKPMPSMPVRLWGDDDGSRLHDSYFSTYPGVWRHGDWIEITDRGSAIIRGRSDSTINRGGVRIGTSEIYRAALSVPPVADALAVDVPLRGTHGFLALFVVLEPGVRLDAALEHELRAQIRSYCSPRHVPDDILQVPQVPRTLTGKVVEVPVKRILQGDPVEEVVSRDSLADPAALDWFVGYATELARRTADTTATTVATRVGHGR